MAVGFRPNRIRARIPTSIDPTGTTTYPLPSALKGDYSFVARNATCTVGDFQYVVWVDDNRKARIARRAWRQPWSTSVDLSTASGTALSADFGLDSHRTIHVSVDGYGHLHVAGDHLVAALRYMRSVKPHDIGGAWTTGMVGTEEESVTYPNFIRAKSGSLFFSYRNRGAGGSSAANQYLNKYNPIAGTWARVCNLFAGSLVGGDFSAYVTDVAVDRSSGRWHVFWTNRTSNVGPQFNEDICYAYTDDEGVTWRKTDGTAYTLPITRATSEVVVDLAGGATETIQNPHHSGAAVDSSGHPHSVWIVADAGGIDRYRHVWHNGTAWQYDTLLPTINAATRRPDIVCFADGRNWMIYNTPGSGSTLKRLDIDSGVVAVLRDVDMITYEPAVEYSWERDTAYIVAPYERQAGALGGEPPDLAAQLSVPVLAVR
jgi:hypothetical protein